MCRIFQFSNPYVSFETTISIYQLVSNVSNHFNNKLLSKRFAFCVTVYDYVKHVRIETGCLSSLYYNGTNF